jgi:hypothetical protein
VGGNGFGISILKREGRRRSGVEFVELELDVVLDVADSVVVSEVVAIEFTEILVDMWDEEVKIIGASGAGNGCAGRVVMFKAGSNTIGSRMCRFIGHKPVFKKALQMVAFLNARSRASE